MKRNIMLKTLKNIRKLYNAKLLFISSDEEVKKTIENEFDEYFKELTLVSTLEDAIHQLEENNYDLAVIDTKVGTKDFDEVCTVITSEVPTLPKIIISDRDSNDDIVVAINRNNFVQHTLYEVIRLF